jgi:menaquinone-9 beta-reductase
MGASNPRYEVAIIGASIAGCSAALLFARQGLRVALIERNSNLNAYKKVCTHYIQSSATPTIERLGLAEPIERAGGLRNGFEGWTRWGWIRPPESPENPRPYGYNIRRQTLDPMLRRMAVDTPGVEYFPGESARALVEENGRVTGVKLETADGKSRELCARLVVGADGRHSLIGQLSGLPQTVKRNDRFAYFAYFRDLPLATGNLSQMWFLEPDIAYAFPNDDGTTILATMPHKDRLPEYRRDLEGSFVARFRSLPDAPDLSRAKQISGILGMLDMPNTSRPAARPGLALIGDAATASDPLWGVGCGWAFQSAEWLVEHTAYALNADDPATLDRALGRYRKAHRRALAGHEFVINDFSARKHYNLIERLFFPAAARDPETARHFEAFGSRRIGLGQFLHPRAVLRAARVNLTYRNKSRTRDPGASQTLRQTQ